MAGPSAGSRVRSNTTFSGDDADLGAATDVGYKPPSGRRGNLIGFLQLGLFFENRDDVNEHAPYVEVYSNGSIVDVEGQGSRGGDAFRDIKEFAKGGFFGIPFGTNPGNPFNDDRRGRSENGTPDLPGEARAAVRSWLNQTYGLSGDNEIQAGALTALQLHSLFNDTRQMQLDLGSQNATLSDLVTHAGFEDMLTRMGVDPSAVGGGGGTEGDEDEDADATTLGGDTLSGAAAGGGGAAGVVGGGAANGLATGVGPGGTQVTGDMLQRFVDSDFAFAFNAAVNEFSDAGAASIFVDWLQGQFSYYRNRAIGQAASQALAGEVPTGGFTNFLRREGILSGEVDDDPGVNPDFAEFSDRQSSGSGSAATGGTPIDALPEDTAAVSPSAGDTVSGNAVVNELLSIEEVQ
jgi:hypothetical protein